MAAMVEERTTETTDRGDLGGKVAVVTGSTSGIGLGVARALAQAGADIVLNGFGDAAEIEAIRAGLERDHGVRAVYAAADMSEAAAIVEMIEGVHADFGRIDILVNNAGVQHVAPIESFPVAKWEQILAINLTAAFHTIRLSVPGMRERGWGRLINIASAHGLVASPFKSAYVAAKHGLIGLTKTVALETAEDGVTCNAVCPGYVWTPLVAAQIKDQATTRGIPEDAVIRDVLLAQQPNKTFATVEQIGAVCRFLAGDPAASITGAALPVDGGWTAH